MGLLGFKSKKDSNKKEDTLINTVNNNLSENSKAVKNVVKGSKKLIVPVSHVLDYALVSFLTLVIFRQLCAYKYF